MAEFSAHQCGVNRTRGRELNLNREEATESCGVALSDFTSRRPHRRCARGSSAYLLWGRLHQRTEPYRSMAMYFPDDTEAQASATSNAAQSAGIDLRKPRGMLEAEWPGIPCPLA